LAGAIVAIAAVLIVVVAVTVISIRRRKGSRSPDAVAGARTHPAPPVAEFHVSGETATVAFDVPLPEGDADEVLRDLLVREAVEVVREKRHHLPIDDVTRVVARARRAGDWTEVGVAVLETPGELPPPAAPAALPGLRADRTFDPFDNLSDLPGHAPGLSVEAGRDVLGPLSDELRIPAALETGLRSQGIDPGATDAAGLILGIMRLGGATIRPRDDDTYDAVARGVWTLVRVVPHGPGDHPELSDSAVRRFAADFATSGADRALLITEKYCPYEVYDRENREPRARYITRERVQHFIDALAVG
jgi:hypothetical protein